MSNNTVSIVVSEIGHGQALATVKGDEEKIFLPLRGKCEVELVNNEPAFSDKKPRYTVGEGTELVAELEETAAQSGYRVAVRWAPAALWEEVAAEAKTQREQALPRKNPNQRKNRKRVVAMA